MKTLEKNLDIQEISQHVIVLPDTSQALFEEGSYGIYTVIEAKLRETLYADWSSFDICSTSLHTLDNGNMIFSYKAVPATASTMSSYSHRHLLVILPKNLI